MPRRVAFLIALFVTAAACVAACGGGSAHREAARTTARADGCGARPSVAPGTTAPQALVSGGRIRTFLLHVPAPYDAARRHRLVIVAHGHGQTAQEPRAVGFDRLADRDHVVVAYPQGLRGPDGRTGWDTFGPNADRGVDDVRFVADLVAHLRASTCLDPARVGIAGLSNGGGLVNVVACRLAGRVDAAAAVAGAFYAIPGGCHPSRPVPFLEVHGTADAAVPYHGDRSLGFPPIRTFVAAWAHRDGCDARPTTITDDRGVTTLDWRSCGHDAVVTGVSVNGAGHGWPGHTTGGAFDAVAAVWDFLRGPRT